MALKLNEKYPGRFNNPSTDYPQGSFKNRTTPTSKDGSYLEKDWANDKEGFFQSLIKNGGLAADGSVDKVGSSQYFDAMLKIGQAQQGIAFTTTGTGTIYKLTPVPAIGAYAVGQRFSVTFHTSSGAAPAIGISSLASVNIKQYSNTGVKVAAVMATDQVSSIVYDGTDFVLIDQLPSYASAASETVSGVVRLATQSEVNAGTDDAAALTAKKLAAVVQGQIYLAATSAGTSTAYILAPVPPASAPGVGQKFSVTFHATSGAAPTIAISGRTAKNLKQYDKDGRKVGAVVAAGQMSNIVYDGTDFVVMDPLPVAVLPATESVVGVARIATQGEVVSGTDDGTIVTPKKLVLGFNRSFGSNGYIAFPAWLGGWVVQWGLAASGVSVISYPLAFPNSALAINFTANDNSTSASANAHYFGSLSASAFTRSASFTNPMRWIAIGY